MSKAEDSEKTTADPLAEQRAKQVQAFMWAVLRGERATEDRMLAEGFDLNTQDLEGKTVLYHVIDSIFNQDIARLCQLGADPNVPDRRGITPFTAAVRTGKLDNAKTALEYGADVRFQPTLYDFPPLYHAIEVDALSAGGQSRTIFLLNHGASLDQLIHFPDGSWRKVGEYAYDADCQSRQPRFEPVIQSMCGRSLAAEFAQAAARRAATGKIRVALSAARRDVKAAKKRLGLE